MIEVLSNAAIGYVLGSIPFGLVVGYVYTGRDIRQVGSGKTGTTNVLRTAGKSAAVIVLLCDVAKGVAPSLLGRFAFDSDAAAAVGGGAAIAGHVFPVFARFRGGRGVATAFGGVLGMVPIFALVFLVIGALLVLATRYVSVMSVVGTPLAVLILAVAAAFDAAPASFAVYGVFAVVVIEYMHLPNIRRLLAGTEPRIGRGGGRAATG